MAARHRRHGPLRIRAFSLVELVMVVTIIGMIAAIAVPRVSQAANAASVSALSATLTNVRKAIDTYYAEHGKYPGYDPVNGTPDGAMFVEQLTRYTNEAGRPNAAYGAPYVYGPYLRAPFPANPFNKLRSVHVKLNHTSPSPADGSVGWVAVLSDGSFGLSVEDIELEKIGITAPEVIGKVKLGVN
jgi:prepilin-type N-terminal cleavage/methylation domain-containing protein